MTDGPAPLEHGGNLDAAINEFGGARGDWIDLSTGINPVPYPLPVIPDAAWRDLPDAAALRRLLKAARRFWEVPDDLEIVAANGASALIAAIPRCAAPGRVHIPGPTYNEHAASFRGAGWDVVDNWEDFDAPDARVLVNPNNPDGKLWDSDALSGVPLGIVDESFADAQDTVTPVRADGSTIILKSFGKFWGLAGMRLGFAICPADLAASLRAVLGPWAVSGPALLVGAAALENQGWAARARARLRADANRLDALITSAGAELAGGTPLFRLYSAGNAARWQNHLATHHIWSRVFSYEQGWLRLGLPGKPDDWGRIARALETLR